MLTNIALVYAFDMKIDAVSLTVRLLRLIRRGEKSGCGYIARHIPYFCKKLKIVHTRYKRLSRS